MRSFLERELELEIIEQHVAAAMRGRGGVVVVDSTAGLGRSRLLQATQRMASERDLYVLTAAATEFERGFPFGLAVQLLEPLWTTASADQRARWVSGPARRAAELLAGEIPHRPDPSRAEAFSVIRSLFWLLTRIVGSCAEAGSPRAMLITVDDAHRADRASLRWLAYLARRPANLPIVQVLTIRAGEVATDRSALSALRTAAKDSLLQLHPLSDEGVASLIGEAHPDASPEFTAASAKVTGGNPLLVVQLLQHLAANGIRADVETAARLTELEATTVGCDVGARLDALAPAARRFAEAVAVLGEHASLYRAARVAGLEMRSAARIADRLAIMHVLDRGEPLTFTHPLVASSLRAATAPLERGQVHRRAANVLSETRAAEERVVAHLLMAPPEADPEAVDVLRRLARQAIADGTPDTAVRLLERALAEGPSVAVYPRLVAELARAQAGAGIPPAVERLRHALAITPDGSVRAELTLLQVGALYDRGRHKEAARIVQDALRDLPDSAAAMIPELTAWYVIVASRVPALSGKVAHRGVEVLGDEAAVPTPVRRVAIAHLAVHRAAHGAARAEVEQLAARAAPPPGGPVDERLIWPLAGALFAVDDLERVAELTDAVLGPASGGASARARVAAGCCRAWLRFEQGRVTEALHEAQAVLEHGGPASAPALGLARATAASCHVMRGELDQAEAALAILDDPGPEPGADLPFLLQARSRLKLAQRRPEAARVDAVEVGRLLSERGLEAPGLLPWRSAAALAERALGRPERSLDLLQDELGRARTAGATRVIIRDLSILGLTLRGADGLERLREAVRVGQGHGGRLETVFALMHFGCALRRANQRTAARGALRTALELSERGGALALAERTRVELVAAGARPRRRTVTGPGSLTPSESRVAELAAGGLTTRQVAESLFVTRKAVEFHLGHVYRKLDISSRGQLIEALRGPAESAGPPASHP